MERPSRGVGRAGLVLCVLALGHLLAPLGALLGAAPAAAQEARAPRPKRTVVVGLYVYNVRDLDFRGQRFGADFYCWLRYDGAPDATVERIEFPYGRIETREELERLHGGVDNYVCWRFSGVFQGRFSLENYPFDRQALEVAIEHPSLEADQLVYAHDEASYRRSPSPNDRWGIKNGLAVPEFTVLGTERRVERYAYETDFGHTEGPTIGSAYSRLVLSVKVRRNFAPYFFKVLIPFLVILAISYLAFYLPREEFLANIVLGLGALLACIAFHTTVSLARPDIGYLVVSDKFFLATLALIGLNLAHSTVEANLGRGGRIGAAERFEIAGRVAYPIIYAGVFAFVLLRALRVEG